MLVLALPHSQLLQGNARGTQGVDGGAQRAERARQGPHGRRTKRRLLQVEVVKM